MKNKVETFRADFSLAVKQLEKDYGINIELGTIRYDANEFRVKLTASNGEKKAPAPKVNFQVGDIVKINHKKVSGDKRFKVIKINNKNIKVQDTNPTDYGSGPIMEKMSYISVSPSLLEKV